VHSGRSPSYSRVVFDERGMLGGQVGVALQRDCGDKVLGASRSSGDVRSHKVVKVSRGVWYYNVSDNARMATTMSVMV